MTATTFGAPKRAGRYLNDSLATASPTVLLVMLYDRLVLDLSRAEQAQLSGDRETAHVNLVHAQDIVNELLTSLKTDVWEGGGQLKDLYIWLLKELSAANVSGDAARTAACRTATVEPLAEAWKQAARQQMAATAAGTGSE